MLHQNIVDLLNDEARIKTLTQEILDNGFIRVSNFFDQETLATLHTIARDPNFQNKKSEQLEGTIIATIGHSPEIVALSQKFHDARCTITGETRVVLDPAKQAIGMPYKNAANETNIETAYHYDGAYINLLFALQMPEKSEAGNGNLILFPSLRRKFSPTNAKLVSRVLRHSKIARNIYGYKEVIYQVDAMHIFFGDISFHGVDPIKSGERVVVTINSHW